jgi:hypothetical protein
MSKRLDRIEVLQEQAQLQINVLAENQIQLQQALQSLAKSVKAYCDDQAQHN